MRKIKKATKALTTLTHGYVSALSAVEEKHEMRKAAEERKALRLRPALLCSYEISAELRLMHRRGLAQRDPPSFQPRMWLGAALKHWARFNLSLQVQLSGPGLSPGTARTCSAGRRWASLPLIRHHLHLALYRFPYCRVLRTIRGAGLRVYQRRRCGRKIDHLRLQHKANRFID